MARPSALQVVAYGEHARRLVSTQSFARGDTVTVFSLSAPLAVPGRHTLQIQEDRHATLIPSCLSYMDHSCSPNVGLDLGKGQLIALKSIAIGAPITYFYPATEWRMAAPFSCGCGAPDCIGRVEGAQALGADVLRWECISIHIQRLIHKGS